MSRIAGIFCNNFPGQGAGLLKPMLASLSRKKNWRSADAASGPAVMGWCGWYPAPNIASVNDIIAVIDGFIFNRAELGPESNDALLLISLYNRYGFAETLRKINGDFAAVLYDPAIDTLWVGRDRFGVKPLYYVSTPLQFAFASQPRPLLLLPNITGEINRQFVSLFAASHYRYFDNRTEQSPYTEIAQLPAASFLQVTKGQVKKTSYWSLSDLPELPESKAVFAEQYRALLTDAVALRVRAAKNPGFTLSGGMDSSSILASAVNITNRKQNAFSTVYEDRTFDESEEIQPMLGTKVEKWYPVMVGTPDTFDLVQKMVQVHDEPVATATWLSHFLLCEQAHKHGFQSLFGGLGGDELNAGEYEYFFFHFADLRLAGREDNLQNEIRMWVQYHDHPIFRKNQAVAEGALTRLVDLSHPGRCLPDRQRLNKYIRALNPDYFDLNDFEPVMDHPFKSYLKNRTYQDLFRETIPCCLRAEDRQTIAFELDNFLPFFDHRLAEFMFRVPGKFKICDGVTKILLREAMRGILPEETRRRVKKTGWNAPSHIWFSGRGKDQLMDLVHSVSFREHGVYNFHEVINIINEHDLIVTSGKSAENHMMFLWQLVNLELWLAQVKRWSQRGPEFP